MKRLLKHVVTRNSQPIHRPEWSVGHQYWYWLTTMVLIIIHKWLRVKDLLGNNFQFFTSVETNLFSMRRNNTAIHMPKSIWLLFHLFEHNKIIYCRIKVYLSLICLKYSLHIVHFSLATRYQLFYHLASYPISFSAAGYFVLCLWTNIIGRIICSSKFQKNRHKACLARPRLPILSKCVHSFPASVIPALTDVFITESRFIYVM